MRVSFFLSLSLINEKFFSISLTLSTMKRKNHRWEAGGRAAGNGLSQRVFTIFMMSFWSAPICCTELSESSFFMGSGSHTLLAFGPSRVIPEHTNHRAHKVSSRCRPIERATERASERHNCETTERPSDVDDRVRADSGDNRGRRNGRRFSRRPGPGAPPVSLKWPTARAAK